MGRESMRLIDRFHILSRKHGKPKLNRKDAFKDIDYDPSTSSSSIDFLSPASIDLSILDKTSFRVEGREGFDSFCQSLGLSGPDDFAIPEAAWLACKTRSSPDPLPLTRTIEQGVEESPTKQGPKSPGTLSNGSRGAEPVSGIQQSLAESSESTSDVKTGNGASGIKGTRPPLLSPPSFSLPSSNGDYPSDFMEEEDDVDGDDMKNDERKVEDLRLEETEPPMSIGSWQKGEQLGRGSFGVVYEGYYGRGGFFAVKEVSLVGEGSQGRDSVQTLEQEIDFLKRFEHENIVRYFGTDKDELHLYIFLELMPKGSLRSLYQKYVLRDSHVSTYTRQILNGLKYLHDRDVMHRDIKCANILVDVNGFAKLADFGLAKATRFSKDVWSCKGTPYWMAPEVVNPRRGGYGRAADIWSLGCTVLEMLTGELPYFPLDPTQAMFQIGGGVPPSVPMRLSRDSRGFIDRCLQVNPEDRPTAADLLDHPFVRAPPPMSPLSSPSPSFFNFPSPSP